MPIVPPPPESVSQCRLVSILREKSVPTDGAIDKVTRFIEAASPLVDMVISGPFREYTLHNRDHCKKLLHLAEAIIPETTIRALSPLEHQVFIYAAYLHDMGMSLTATERARILESDDFQDALQTSEEIADTLARARKRLGSTPEPNRLPIETEIYQLQEAALAGFLRPRHASPGRYRELIAGLKRHSNRPDLFEYRGVSFEEILVDVCTSHNLDAGVLAEVRGPHEERFPRRMAIGGAYLNAQFCAALLRLTDILDFDRERTPQILFESLGISIRSLPGAEVSLREWQKHMAVHTLEVNPDEVVVSAETHHPVIEKTIRDFCVIIEREIRDTLTILKQNNPPVTAQYLVELPVNVRPQIRPIGYVYKDMSLSLNQARIMTLLMGERLYPEPAVALRELVQNSIDACSVRQEMEGDRYVALIDLTADRDEVDRWWLEVSDNGCGMDEHVLSEYFLKVGNSYYSSPEFARLRRRSGETLNSFTPISRFGIGLVSVFLIGDVLEVYTRSGYSPRHDELQRHLRIERLGGLAFVTEHESDEIGTRMRLRLRHEYGQTFAEFEAQLAGYLQRTIVRPRFPITVRLPEGQFILASRPGIRLRPNARELLSSGGLEAVLIDIERWSDRFTGTVGLVFSKTGDGKLSHLRNGRYLRFGSTGIRPEMFLENYGGNRLTVNGFSMTLKRASRVLGKGKNRLAVVFDLEVRGDKDVDYDISRARVVGQGRQTVMAALERAIRDGLRDTGIMDRLDPVTRRVVEGGEKATTDELVDTFRKYDNRPVTDEALLEQVEKLVPIGAWPKGLHKLIAEQLSISNNLSVRVIQTLLQIGRISHVTPSPQPSVIHDTEGSRDSS